jgi:hypothetical protein
MADANGRLFTDPFLEMVMRVRKTACQLSVASKPFYVPSDDGLLRKGEVLLDDSGYHLIYRIMNEVTNPLRVETLSVDHQGLLRFNLIVATEDTDYAKLRHQFDMADAAALAAMATQFVSDFVHGERVHDLVA